MRDMHSMRLGCRSARFRAKCRLEYSAFESGLLRFIRLDKEADRIGKQALGLVDNGLHEIGTELGIEILGEMFKATVIEESPYDPQNEKFIA